jgi:hypothetical protein
LLLMAAGLSGCLLPESVLVDRPTKSAAPSAQRTVDAGNRSDAGQRGATGKSEDAATRGAADDKCADAEDDAGRSAQGACCTAPAPCYDGPKASRGVGRCSAGMRDCVSGKLGACEGSVLPRAEACDNAGSDDDCDGQLDNVPSLGTACTPQGADTCGAGALACNTENTALICVAESPPAELCNKQDDDCDMKVDETFDLKRDASNCGACGTRCGSEQACCQGACVTRGDGPDGCPACSATQPCGSGDTCCQGACVDTRSDASNCGACGMKCGDREACCDGKCIDVNADEVNCGGCGTICNQGTMPSCCAGTCVDLSNDRRNCGQCGNNCGVVCTCEPNDGEPQCRGSLGVCF